MRLSHTSERLVAFVSNLNIDLPPLHDRHRRLLQRQYDHFVKWAETIEKEAETTHEQTDSKPDRLRDNDFVDPKILARKSQKAVLCRYKFKNLELRVHVEAEKVDRSLQPLLPHLMAIMCMFGQARTVDIFYVPSSAKKLLPPKGTIIGPANINSGSTLAAGHGPIDVWRREEFAKLFFHESLHCLRCDIKNFPKRFLQKFYDLFRIDRLGCDKTFSMCRTSLFPNEAYVEALADIVHTMYVCHVLQQQPFITLLMVERRWALFQAAKVLRHYNFERLEDLWDDEKHKCWRQNSNVFSYIIIRAALLYHIGPFLDFLSHGDSFLCFANPVHIRTDTEDRVGKFSVLAINLIKSPEMCVAVNRMMMVKCGDAFVSQTLRMTALEM